LGLTAIVNIVGKEARMAFKADRRLWLTEDDRVVDEGDPAARFLLVCEGGEVDAETVKKYDLKHREAPAAENKLSSKAPQNKAAKE
jgi:hypothetical protein